MVIGLTGGIGSGQTTVAHMFKRRGAIIVDADKIARLIFEPGQAAYTAVVNAFGEKVLTEEGRIDRKKLGTWVFHNRPQLNLLNRTVHPILINRIKQEVNKIKQQEIIQSDEEIEPLIIIDAAILLEMKLQSFVDKVIVVYAPIQIRIKRIAARDNLPVHEIAARIAAQMPIEKKIKLADYVIDNSASLAKTKNQVTQLWAIMKIQSTADRKQ